MVVSPKISVIIPVYNAEKYLAKCIDSLLTQTLEEIEIILVDDGSTDQSAGIADSYAQNDHRIKVVHTPNGGPSKARNTGISMATGEYIGFVDADDYVSQNMFETMYVHAATDHNDITICEYAIVAGSTEQRVSLHFRKHYSGTDVVKRQLLQRYYIGETQGLYSLCNKLFSRKFICDFGLKLDETLYRAEDAWFIFDCLKCAKQVGFTNNCLYFYRQNTTSIMHTVKKDQFTNWVNNKRRLLEENKSLQFELDYHAFYGDFLYKTAVFFRDYLRIGETKFVKSAFEHPLYQEAIRFRKNIPFHVQLLHGLVAHRMKGISILLYHLWGKVTNG